MIHFLLSVYLKLTQLCKINCIPVQFLKKEAAEREYTSDKGGWHRLFM